MLELYRKRLGMYGNNMNEAIMNINQEIMDQCFTATTTYKRVRIGTKYYDARFMRDVADSVEQSSGNYVIQFRNDITFPMGTYIYIPNRTGKEEPWMLVSNKDDVQFPKNCILKCNYTLRWLSKYKLIEYPVAIRIKNSYTDGVKQGEEFNLLDNQAMFWIPYNDDSMEITYNMRFLLSHNPKYPQAYSVTKINDLVRPGVIEVTLLQDQLGTYDNGELMCADYNISEWICDINLMNTGSSLSIQPETSFQLELSGVINDMPVDMSYFTFTSSDPSIIKVDKTGLITAVDVGDAVITVTLGNTSKKISVHVSAEIEDVYNIEVVDPDGDYVLRLRFEKILNVVIYNNGEEIRSPNFECEIISGQDFASYTVDENRIILTATPDLNNIGKIISLRVYNTEYNIESIQDIVVKGVI